MLGIEDSGQHANSRPFHRSAADDLNEAHVPHALVLSVSAAERVVRNSQSRGHLAVFLDDDYSGFLRLRDAGRDNGWEWRTCKDIFHQTYAELEPEFLAVFAMLAKQNDPRLYWQSQVASRSAASNALPRLTTYLACAAAILKSEARPVLFVVTDPGLAIVVSRALIGRTTWYTFFWYRWWKMRQCLVYVLRLTRFVISAVRAVWTLPNINVAGLAQSKQPICLIRGWIIGKYEASDGADRRRYVDRNFGDLHIELAAVGLRPIYMPMHGALKQPIAHLHRTLADTDAEFIFAEQIIKIVDILKVAWLGIKELGLRFEGARIRQWDVKDLFEYAHLKSVLSDDLLTLNLGGEALRRLQLNGVAIAKIMYPFENNPPEKSLLLDARAYHPQATLVGYQHSPWYKEQPSMKVSPLETDHPLPDRIVASGKVYKTAMIASGFPSDRICLGANLRFVVSTHDQPIEMPTFDLLVVFNYSIKQSTELLSYVAAALQMSALRSIKVGIKPHPLLNRSAVVSIIHKVELHNWKVIDTPVAESCRQARMALVAGSSIANLEVLLSGRPLLQHSLENDFDRDCVWHEDDRLLRTTGVTDLARAIEKALKFPLDFDIDVRRRILIESYFMPKSPASMRAFLE